MKIQIEEDDIIVVAKALARSRGLSPLTVDFDRPWAPDTTEDRIYTEATRALSALREHVNDKR